jgi:hypothetical protein
MIEMSLACWYTCIVSNACPTCLAMKVQYFRDSTLCRLFCAYRHFRRIVSVTTCPTAQHETSVFRSVLREPKDPHVFSVSA